MWKITSGEHKDSVATRITGPKPTNKNACGKIINALIGKPLGNGEDVEIGDYVGKAYMIIVAAAESGGSRVETVANAPQ